MKNFHYLWRDSAGNRHSIYSRKTAQHVKLLGFAITKRITVAKSMGLWQGLDRLYRQFPPVPVRMISTVEAQAMMGTETDIIIGSSDFEDYQRQAIVDRQLWATMMHDKLMQGVTLAPSERVYLIPKESPPCPKST